MQQQSTHDSPLPHVVPTPHPFVSSAPHIFSSFLWLNWSNRQISCNWVGKGELDQISCALFSLSFFPTFKLSLPFSCFSIHFSYLDQLATATSWENEDIRLNSSQDCVCLLHIFRFLLVIVDLTLFYGGAFVCTQPRFDVKQWTLKSSNRTLQLVMFIWCLYLVKKESLREK